MTETWIWDPGQEDDTRSSDGTGARCCTLPHPQKREDLALRPVQAGNPTNRVPGNSVVARVSLGQCGGVCDGTQWAAGRALPRSPAADATDASTPLPANPRTHAAVPPRSPGSASVPRRAILRPNPPWYPTSRGPTNPEGSAGSGGSGGEPHDYARPAEGSRTTTSGERSTAAPMGTDTTQPHTQLGAWGWFWLTPQTGCATRPPRAARQSSSGRHAPAGTGWRQPHHQQEDLDRKWI